MRRTASSQISKILRHSRVPSLSASGTAAADRRTCSRKGFALGRVRAMSQAARMASRDMVSTGLVLEGLERRDLMSAATPTLNHAILTVYGTGFSDVITINRDPHNSANIQVTVDGKSQDFLSDNLAEIDVYAGNGNNVIRADDSHGVVRQLMKYIGGTGNDTLVAGRGPDTLIGGGGNDDFQTTSQTVVVQGVDPAVGQSSSKTRHIPHTGRGVTSTGTGSTGTGSTGTGSTGTGSTGTGSTGTGSTGTGNTGTGSTGTGSTGTGSTGTGSTGTGGTGTGTGTGTTVGNDDSALGTDFFPIAVFSQPTSSFDHWKALGVNTLYAYESQGGTVSMTQWSGAAVSDGLYMIRQASTNPSTDASQQNLIAWMLPDEPEENSQTAASLQSTYAALKAADPNMPVIENFSGGYVLGWQSGVSAAGYSAYAANTNWDATDIYPVTGWGQPTKLNAVGQAVQQMSADSNGNPQFAFIETSNQQLSWVPNDTGVTPDQFREEVWDAIISGARGLVYFPQQIGNGFQYDATPANVQAEMAKQDALIESIGPALESTQSTSTLGLSLPTGLTGTIREYDGKDYFIVLNTTNSTVNGNITLSGTGSATTATVAGESRSVSINSNVISDSFGAYDVHIYQIG